MGVIKGDIRRLDYSSFWVVLWLTLHRGRPEHVSGVHSFCKHHREQQKTFLGRVPGQIQFRVFW